MIGVTRVQLPKLVPSVMNFVKMKLIPEKNWGKKFVNAPNGLVDNLKSLGQGVSQKPA
jgi:hypothetical protein